MKELGTGGANECKRGDLSWADVQSPPSFPTARVDVWRVLLSESAPAVSEANALSSDEIARASRYHFEKDRVHFTRCRSALRDILARYLAISAAEIHFEYLPRGKPQLVAEQNPRALCFNVSHSGNIALIAVGSEHRLGVDIEKIRADVDTTALAERFFSPRERAGLQGLPDPLRVPGFFACWTRKESFLKGTGDGLAFSLADFSVTTHPDLVPTLEEIKGKPIGATKWCLADLSVGNGYRATVAVDRPHFRLETYHWN